MAEPFWQCIVAPNYHSVLQDGKYRPGFIWAEDLLSKLLSQKSCGTNYQVLPQLFYQTLLGEQEKPQERALLGPFCFLTSQFDICHIMYLPKP